ncbi:hypothetical protein SEPCBS57363_003497 [Sporothrix epigloea]|uniref:Aminotransferase n=1 Tax=Sporothrix epigloea TaxID=1892477 RepID=A0ABP0DPJ6_9PEZI
MPFVDTAISQPAVEESSVPVPAPAAKPKSAVFYRQLRLDFPAIVRGEGSYLVLDDGRRILDASGGAAVACIGHSDARVGEAIMSQMKSASYCATLLYTSTVCEELCRLLVDSTNGQMARAYIVCSGSEAMEAALKLARQYFLEKTEPEPQRTRFIARQQSYHGNTLGALAVGGHKSRRLPFEPIMSTNVSHVSPCYAYRGKKADESDAQYVARLVDELDAEFQRLGPETVCAFVAEPVVGGALGAVPSLPGYFKAIQAVCRKYGALFICDEVMCGMGRTGTLHAWQQEEGVLPDIQTYGKCLGGGYQPIAGVLASHEIVDTMSKGSGAFVTGHTYQGHPVSCAAALAVQRIVAEENLLANVSELGPVLGELLTKRLGDHPYVGDIRGRGFFWGIELVEDKATARPFPPKANVAMEIVDLGLKGADYSVALYPGNGTADGVSGDHIILAPMFNASRDEIETIVDRVARLVEDYFAAKCA